MTWFVDRSRYMEGFVCPWRRLLRYHANLEPLATATPLATGLAIHRSLELLLQPYILNPATTEPARDLANLTCQQALRELPPGTWESASDPQLQRDLMVALTHGYARITLPWLLEHFDILHLEQEQVFKLDHPQMPLTWMSRPDMICRHKQTGTLSIHDFKTTSYWKDSNLTEWSESVQMMMQAHVCAQTLGEPVPHYYVHFLVKGSEEYPSPLVSAWYREPMPPFQTEDWQVKKPYGKELKYRKVRVIDHRKLDDWVWNMPLEDCIKGFIIGGPFPVYPEKVNQFLAGLPANEWFWQQSLGDNPHPNLTDPHVRAHLDRTFPRTYQCHTYGSRCPYYKVCFTNEWAQHYKTRTPHHTTEEL